LHEFLCLLNEKFKTKALSICHKSKSIDKMKMLNHAFDEQLISINAKVNKP